MYKEMSAPTQPFNICPNGQTAMGNSDGVTNSCQPITCPSGFSVTPDEHGTIGCAVPGKSSIVCPSGQTLTPTDGCQMTPGLINATDSNGMRNYKVCPNNYKKNSIGACQYIGFTCPDSVSHGKGFQIILQNNVPGCSIADGNEIVCPTGYQYTLDPIGDMLTCTGIDSYLASDKGNCPNKYESVPDDYGNNVCQPIEPRASTGFTSRVNYFKKESNKCKLKY
jgi:hypothetical protein